MLRQATINIKSSKVLQTVLNYAFKEYKKKNHYFELYKWSAWSIYIYTCLDDRTRWMSKITTQVANQQQWLLLTNGTDALRHQRYLMHPPIWPHGSSRALFKGTTLGFFHFLAPSPPARRHMARALPPVPSQPSSPPPGLSWTHFPLVRRCPNLLKNSLCYLF